MLMKVVEDFVIEFIGFQDEASNKRIRKVLQKYDFYEQMLEAVVNGEVFLELEEREMIRIKNIANAWRERKESRIGRTLDYDDVTMIDLTL